MEIKLKHVLIGAGILTAAGALVYVALRPDEAKAMPSPTPGPSPAPPRGPGEIGVTHPVWSRQAATQAAAIMADIHAEMGSPGYDPNNPNTAIELAWTTASEMWPNWSWPTTPTQSALFVQSADLGRPVWEQLVTMAQIQLGYVSPV
jgi:hypothetical protein